MLVALARRAGVALVGLTVALGLIVVPPGVAVADDRTTCSEYPDFPVPPETYLLPHSVCVTKVDSRRYRGYVTFTTLREFQMAGRYFVTLKQGFLPLKKSRNYVNPLIKPGGLTNWYTPWVSSGKVVSGIEICATTWFRRTSKLNVMVSQHCVTP